MKMITARIHRAGSMLRVNLYNGLNEIFDFAFFALRSKAIAFANKNGAERIYFD